MYFSDLKISSSDLVGFAATLVLQDLKTNKLSLGGFPEISVKHGPESFEFYFSCQGQQVGPYTVGFKEAVSKVKAFRKAVPVDTGDVKTIQPFLVELESAVSAAAVIAPTYRQTKPIIENAHQESHPHVR
jgi:hypothetical protein